MPGRERSRNWVFTFNNPPKPYGSLEVDDSTYLMYQLEKGSCLHYQGFILFSSLKSLSQMRVYIPGARFAVMKGTVKDSENYCSKDDATYISGPWKFGTAPVGSGTRSDLVAVQKMCDEGASELEIAQAHFGTWTRIYHAVSRYKRLRTPIRYIKIMNTLLGT